MNTDKQEDALNLNVFAYLCLSVFICGHRFFLKTPPTSTSLVQQRPLPDSGSVSFLGSRFPSGLRQPVQSRGLWRKQIQPVE
jgi:hypothetical protein